MFGSRRRDLEQRVQELETELEGRSLQGWWVADLERPFGSLAGVNVNRTTALGLSAAWRAVTLLTESVATLPVDVIIQEGDRRVPLASDDPRRPQWLDNPGQGLTGIDVRAQMMASMLLEGETIVLTPRTDGEVQSLVVLDPVEITIDPSTGMYSAVGLDLTPGEFFHIRGLMLPTRFPNERRGLSPIEVGREGFGAAMATQQFGASFFGNFTAIGGVVEVPGPLSEDGQKALKAYINDRHRGSSNAHKIGVLIEGAKLGRPLTFSAEDAQFLQTKDAQIGDVARYFGVDPEMIGGNSGDSLTYSTLEGRGTHFVTYSLLRWLVRLELAFTMLWRSEGGPPNGEIKINVKGLLRGSTKERYDAYEVGLRAGFLSVDEVRALEDLPPLGGGQEGDGGNG